MRASSVVVRASWLVAGLVVLARVPTLEGVRIGLEDKSTVRGGSGLT